MFTVCSKCNLRLAVTATDLRAAQGYVRCGRCHNVFNALTALADDPALPVADATTADTQRRPVLKPPEPPPPDPSESPRPPQDNSTMDVALEFNPASTNINEVFIEAVPGDHTGSFESITLAEEEPAPRDAPPQPTIAPQALSSPGESPATDRGLVDLQRMRDALAEPAPRPVTAAAGAPDTLSPAAAAAPPDATLAADTRPIPDPDGAGAQAATALPAGEAAPAPAAAAAAADGSTCEPLPFLPDWSDAPDAAVADPETLQQLAAAEPAPATGHAAPAPTSIESPPGAARVAPWVGRVGAVALGLCLLLQVVHHHRNELAGTALLHAPLTALYAALGTPLAPRWDIAAYEIRQLGATTDGAAGNLVVRASISNHAPRDQPLPLLRVVMQDQIGNRVAGRDLQPAEYLGAAARRGNRMAPGERVDVQVDFRDPGQAVTGFELDACMAAHDRTVSCANDPGVR